MDKAKWLWKRKSSERSHGESESSGSVSSYSERLSEDQDGLKSSPKSDAQSPEVTSDNVAADECANDSVKCLTEKLSAALVNVSAKDDLVKQHSKVAEEAVAGWEKAENELAALKKQYEAAIKQNISLEDRVCHLDGALKECVRQLRQAKEEHEEKIHEALTKQAREWESTISKLEKQLMVLKMKEDRKLESSSQKDQSLSNVIEYLEYENESLKLELHALSDEIEVRIIERDLSAQAAETASKQHLESIKKVAKLEAECRRLKAAAKTSSISDHRPFNVSSINVGSHADSQSDSVDRLKAMEMDIHKIGCSHQFKNEKDSNQNLPSSSMEIDLMEDFLEMEQLAGLPETQNGTHSTEPEAVASQRAEVESFLRAELEVATNRTAELERELHELQKEKDKLEEKLERTMAECANLEIALHKSKENNEDLESQLMDTHFKLEELQDYLYRANKSIQQTESLLASREVEARTMTEKIKSLEAKIEKERTQSVETAAKLHESIKELENQLKESQLKLKELRNSLSMANESKQKAESQLNIRERSMSEKIHSLEAEIEKERSRSEGLAANSTEKNLESENRLRETQTMLEELQGCLSSLTESKQQIESQLVSMEEEARTMSEKISSLEAEVEKERSQSAEATAKCRRLEEELSTMIQQVNRQQIALSNSEPKIKQEDLEVAAGKLAECQKTIASLGKQLKSLATLEDFLIDTSSLPEVSPNGEPWKYHSNETFSPKRDSISSKAASDSSVHWINRIDFFSPPSSPAFLSTPATKSPNRTSTERNRNGFAKFFSRGKNGIQLEL